MFYENTLAGKPEYFFGCLMRFCLMIHPAQSDSKVLLFMFKYFLM